MGEQEAALQTQIRFLEKSAREFDEGDESEALRLASTLRILLHHNPQQNAYALLQQVGLIEPGTRSGMFLLETATFPRPQGAIGMGEFPLCSIELRNDATNVGARFVPSFSAPRELPARHVPYDEWWNAAVIITPSGIPFSRRRVVRTMANEDGGSHVDRSLERDYYSLTRGGAMGWKIESEQESGALRLAMSIDARTGRPVDKPGDVNLNPAPATVRQIAHEVLESLRGPRRKMVAYRTHILRP